MNILEDSPVEVPKHFRPVYSHSVIAERTQELGKEISGWAEEVWNRSHTDVLAIPVLRGGIFFFADLVRAISCSTEIVPAQSWGYKVGENAEQRSKVDVQVEQVPATGRAILLVDDICDSGKTLEALTTALQEKGAQEVRSCVLIRRVIDAEQFNPDWVGFEYEGDEWFVGYGMEDAERFRNLPDIYTIGPEKD